MMTTDDFKYLVGKTVDEAKKELPPRYSIFIWMQDGQGFYRPQEFNPYRINVIVKNGRISGIDGIN